MLTFGIISELDPTRGRARVRFPNYDNIVSSWLPCSVAKSLKEKVSFPYDINEHVWCVMDHTLQDGIVGGCIYSQNERPALISKDEFGIVFDNGLSIKYDRLIGTLSINGSGNIKIDVEGSAIVKCVNAEIESVGELKLKAASKIIAEAPITEFTGQVSIAGIVTAGGIAASTESGTPGNATIAGNLSVSGNIEAEGEVSVNGVGLKSHRHGGVQTGSGISDVPVP